MGLFGERPEVPGTSIPGIVPKDVPETFMPFWRSGEIAIQGSRLKEAARFTSADIRRAIKAAEAAGKNIAAIDFPREGGFWLLLVDPQPSNHRTSRKNEWGDVLPWSQ